MWMRPALLALAGCAAPARPNLLLITLDTTRADAIGAYGSRTGATPNLDQLATEGVRFERAYTVTPLTIPAHSSIHTGLYPPRHGVRDNGDYFLGDDAVTLAERLDGAGYRTMASVAAEVTSHHWGFSQGFDAYFDDMGAPSGPNANRWKVERPGGPVVDDALAWLDAGREAKEPWFAWVHLFDAHHPYEPPEPYASRFDGRPYIGEVAYVDAQVGRLRAWLADHGQLENTWIVVVADHGEGLGSHGEGMHGVLLYDATTRIPMLVRGPRARAGLVVGDLPVSLVDLSPTMLELAGVPLDGPTDGMSLAGVLAGDAPPADRNVYAESQYAWHHYGWSPLAALVSPTHKLIRSTTPELYARADVAEGNDLRASQPELARSLDGALSALETTFAPAVTASRADLSAERVSQLEALGYLTSGAAEPTSGTTLPDPVKQLPVLKKLEAARQAFRTGDLAAARVAVEAALEADPGLVETRLLSCSLALREGRVEEALRLAQALVDERVASDTLGNLAVVLLDAHRPADAAETWRQALELDPYVGIHWVGYLHALAMAGSPALPAESERAMGFVPEVPEVKAMRGVALASSGRFALARPLLAEALAVKPVQPFAHYAQGLVKRADGDVNGAEAAFEEDVRLFPPALPSRRALVALYADQKRYDAQLAQLEAIRATEPPSAETLHSTAQALFNLGRYHEADPLVRDCRLLAPAYVGCALLEANVLKKLGREDEALEAFARAKLLAGVDTPAQ